MDFKRQKKSISAVLACAYFVCFARFFTIRNQIGDEGVGLFAASFLIYFIYMIVIREVFSELIAKMINSRMKRDQYKNAGRSFDFSLLMGAMSGIIACAIVFFMSGFLARTVLGMEHSVYVIRYMAPAYAFGTVTAVFSGYLKGVGDHITDALLRLLSELITSLLCILMAGVVYSKGIKVGALLHQDIFGAVYGAKGCGIAFSLAAFITMLLYILLYAQTKVAFKRRTIKDVAAREEEYSVYVQNLYISPLFTYISVLLTALCLFVEERILVSHVMDFNKAHPDQAMNIVQLWGRYFGKGMLFVAVPIAAIYVIYQGLSGFIKRSLNQDDRKSIREVMQVCLRKYIMISLPLTVFLFVFTQPLMQFFNKGTFAEVVLAVQLGTVSIFLFGLAYIFMQVCIAMDKKLYMLVIQAVAFIMHIIIMRVGVGLYKEPASAIGLAQIASALLMAVLYGVLLTLQLDYKHNILHFVKPLISTAISGLIGFLIVKLFVAKVSAILTLLIGSIVFVILYLISMAALHGFSKKELTKLPGGAFLLQLFYHR